MAKSPRDRDEPEETKVEEVRTDPEPAPPPAPPLSRLDRMKEQLVKALEGFQAPPEVVQRVNQIVTDYAAGEPKD